MNPPKLLGSLELLYAMESLELLESWGPFSPVVPEITWFLWAAELLPRAIWAYGDLSTLQHTPSPSVFSMTILPTAHIVVVHMLSALDQVLPIGGMGEIYRPSRLIGEIQKMCSLFGLSSSPWKWWNWGNLPAFAGCREVSKIVVIIFLLLFFLLFLC